MESKHLTLESEISNFANNFPYWEKYLAGKILSGKVISGEDTNNSYSYLLQEIKINQETDKTKITISYGYISSGNYKSDQFPSLRMSTIS